MKGRKSLLVLIIAGVILISAVAWANTQKDKNASVTEPEAVTPVKVTAVGKDQLVSTIKLSGKVTASQVVSLAPQTGGKVTEINVEVGQRVKKGDLLMVLNDADIRAQIKLYEAALEVSQAGQQQAVIAYQDAEKNLARMDALFTNGAISRSQLEDAQAAFARAAASYSPASGRTQTEAQIKQAQAQLETARINLANTRLTAPIDGVIAARNIEQGEMASPGSPVLIIANTDQMIVEGSFAESEVNFAQTGDEVRVYVPSAGLEPFAGIIDSVSPVSDAVTRAFPVRFKISNASQLLKSGMTAEVHMIAEARKDVLVVPREAVINQGDKQIVFVVKNSRAEERVVSLGLLTDTKAEIAEGLAVGEQIVVSGQQFLSDSSKVKLEAGGE